MNSSASPLKIAHLVVHGFALAHAALAALILSQHLDPGIFLTILTIAMIVILAKLNDYPLDVTTALTLIFCLGGFFLGTTGAKFFTMHLRASPFTAQIITTVLVTEILGWITFFIVRRTQKKE
jgi:two-component system, LytTR family, sensor kinase